MSFLLVRPQSKINESVQTFESKGLSAVGLAAINIVLLDDTELASRFVNFNAEIVILTSTYAAQWFIKECTQISTHCQHIVCIGESTANSLRALAKLPKIEVASPETSEGLLTLKLLENPENKKIAIIKGENGRTLIQQTLAERGALTSEFNVYKRMVNLPALQAFTFEHKQIKCIISASNEIIDALFANYDPVQLCSLPWIVASRRIQEYAVNKGISQVFVSKGASIEALSKSALELVRTGVVND